MSVLHVNKLHLGGTYDTYIQVPGRRFWFHGRHLSNEGDRDMPAIRKDRDRFCPTLEVRAVLVRAVAHPILLTACTDSRQYEENES